MKAADKDILEVLAELSLAEECARDVGDKVDQKIASQAVVTFSRVVREADYEIPANFDFWEYMDVD